MCWGIMPKVRRRSAHFTGEALTCWTGPFLFPGKKGAHEELFLLDAANGIESFDEVYSAQALDQPGVKIITAAPDVPGVLDCIRPVTKRGVTFSIGHS